jgi:hypothetical protein
VVVINGLLFKILNIKNVIDLKFFGYIAMPVFTLVLIIKLLSGKPKEESKKSVYIELEHQKGKVRYENPFNGFLVYGEQKQGKHQV